MLSVATALTGMLMFAAPIAGEAQGPWVLACDVGASGADGSTAHRTFRLGPQLFQEWKPAEHEFGPNLCRSFKCAADKNKLEGVISSSSLIVTIRLDRPTGQASWRTVGASGLSRSQGPCSLTPDPAELKRDR